MKALDTYNELLDLLKSAVLKITKTLPHKVQILQEAAMAHVKAKSLEGIYVNWFCFYFQNTSLTVLSDIYLKTISY